LVLTPIKRNAPTRPASKPLCVRLKFALQGKVAEDRRSQFTDYSEVQASARSQRYRKLGTDRSRASTIVFIQQQRGGAMTPEERKRFQWLCTQVTIETDPKKFDDYMREWNDLLEPMHEQIQAVAKASNTNFD
jgi:hypothetical protein